MKNKSKSNAGLPHLDDFYLTVPHTVEQPIHVRALFNHLLHLILGTKTD